MSNKEFRDVIIRFDDSIPIHAARARLHDLMRQTGLRIRVETVDPNSVSYRQAKKWERESGGP